MSLIVVTALIDILGLLALGVWNCDCFMGFFLLALVLFFLRWYMSLCVYWHILFFIAAFCIFVRGKVTAFASFSNITPNTDTKSTPQHKGMAAQNKHTRTYVRSWSKCQCSRRSPGMSSNALSKTSSGFLQRAS